MEKKLKRFIVVQTFSTTGESFTQRSFEKKEDALKFAELLSLGTSFGTYNVAEIITGREAK